MGYTLQPKGFMAVIQKEGIDDIEGIFENFPDTPLSS